MKDLYRYSHDLQDWDCVDLDDLSPEEIRAIYESIYYGFYFVIPEDFKIH